MADKEKTAKVVGKILTSPKFRLDLAKNPDATLSKAGVALDSRAKQKLLELSKKVTAGKHGGAELHCEVASSVGYA